MYNEPKKIQLKFSKVGQKERLRVRSCIKGSREAANNKKKKARVASLRGGVRKGDPPSRRYVIDSGACINVLNPECMTKAEKQSIKKTADSLKVSTANGETKTNKLINFNIRGLKLEGIPARVLEQCPPILSLGRLIVDYNFSFEWKPRCQPTLTASDGQIIHLCVQNYVPTFAAEDHHHSNNLCKTTTKLSTKTNIRHNISESSLSLGDRDVAEIEVDNKHSEDIKQNADPHSHEQVLPTNEYKPETSSRPAERQPMTFPNTQEVPCEDIPVPDTDIEGDGGYEADDVPEGHALTHFPKHPRCRFCQLAKMQSKPCRKRTEVKIAADDGIIPEGFGGLVTADHIILASKSDFSRHSDTVSLVMQDRKTMWLMAYPAAAKSTECCIEALNQFTKPTDKVMRFYSDNALELAKSVRSMGWRHDTCTENRPQTNGVAERAVRRVLDGSRTVLFQSGMDHSWWAEATQCYCYNRNITDVIRQEGKTPYELRHGTLFPGKRIPFGALVDYKPSTGKLLKFAVRTLPGIFVGYASHAGGEWSGSYLVVDVDAYRSAACHSQTYVHTIKEVIVNGAFRFPIAEGSVVPENPVVREATDHAQNNPLGDREFNRIRPAWEEQDEIHDQLGTNSLDSGGSSSSSSDIRRAEMRPIEDVKSDNQVSGGPTTTKSKNIDRWEWRGDYLVRIHNQPRTTMFSPAICDDPPPIELNQIDVERETRTNLDEASEMKIIDVWDGSPDDEVDLSGKWTGETLFKKFLGPPPPGKVWSDGKLVRKQKTSRPDNIWPEVWAGMGDKAKSEAIRRWPAMKKKIDDARTKRGLVATVHSTLATLANSKRGESRLMFPLIEDLPSDDPEVTSNTTKDAQLIFGAWALQEGMTIKEYMKKRLIDRSTPHLAMPISSEECEDVHREKDGGDTVIADSIKLEHHLHNYLGVVQNFKIDEAMKIPEAKNALDTEWTRLIKETFDWKNPRGYRDVQREAEAANMSIHFAQLLQLIGLKHSELDKKFQKWKGRVVIKGDQMKDQAYQAAIFQELSSSASLMSASKMLDIIGHMPGMSLAQADAIQAYPQANLGGPPTWVVIPPERRPATWKNLHKPVVRLVRALYGHPLAGVYWEKHCRAALVKVGFRPMLDWESCYLHDELSLVLSVYVDDFKLAGPTENMNQGWKLISKHLDIEPPTAMDKYLGCGHEEIDIDPVQLRERMTPYSPHDAGLL